MSSRHSITDAGYKCVENSPLINRQPSRKSRPKNSCVIGVSEPRNPDKKNHLLVHGGGGNGSGEEEEEGGDDEEGWKEGGEGEELM